VEETPGRAMRVAHALQARDGDEFAKPGNLVEVRFVKGQSLSLTAARLLALMILTAGGDAWEPVAHRMRKADIRRGHKGNERISDMLEELHRTLFAADDLSWRGRKATKRFSLIQSSREEVDEEGSEAGWIEWEFTPDARRLIRESETYAVLNRQAVLGFRSSYALRLYEMGALRLYRRQSVWRGDMTAIRAAFGIAPELYKDFAQLRRKVLDKAKAEIDHLAHFTVDWREIRRGRTIVEIEFTFHPKSAPAQLVAADDDNGGGVRPVALPESAAQPAAAPPALPAPALRSAARPKANDTALRFPSGTLQYGAEPFGEIARVHGGGWARDLIADAYREQMDARLANLTGAKLVKSWTGFCQAFAARRGRP
jgi:replication initiator protein